MIAVKLDEDLPHDLVSLLQAHGFDASNVRLQGWTGKPDGELLADVQAEGRWLFTADKGFSDIRRYVPGSHRGIVLLRPDRESQQAYVELVVALIRRTKLEDVPGALVVVTSRAIRVVRPSAP